MPLSCCSLRPECPSPSLSPHSRQYKPRLQKSTHVLCNNSVHKPEFFLKKRSTTFYRFSEKGGGWRVGLPSKRSLKTKNILKILKGKNDKRDLRVMRKYLYSYVLIISFQNQQNKNKNFKKAKNTKWPFPTESWLT